MLQVNFTNGLYTKPSIQIFSNGNQTLENMESVLNLTNNNIIVFQQGLTP